MKVDTLHKLLEEYGSQVQWVKDLDFKIIYYTLALLVGIDAWFAANPPSRPLLPSLYAIVAFLAAWSIVFLWRNHSRHGGLLDKLQQVHDALLLTEPKAYGTAPLEKTRSSKDLAFHSGRILYGVAILIASSLSAVFITSVAPMPICAA